MRNDWQVAADTQVSVNNLESIVYGSDKPIRILKRPTSQSQLSVINDTIPTIELNNNNSSFSNTISSSTTEPVVSIIPQNENSSKRQIKTYEQREREYRLARLRIMGEEESSAVDDMKSTSLTFNNPSQPIDSSQSSFQSHSIPGAYYFQQQQYHGSYYPQMSLIPPAYYPTTTYYMPISNTWYPYQQQASYKV